MPCLKPMQAYSSLDEDGKRRLKFSNPLVKSFHCGSSPEDLRDFCAISGFDYTPVPCGKCISCRLERSRLWAVRCVHEASMYDSNCFVTLTYAPEFLPADLSVSKDVLSDFFMRRIRKRFGNGIRFFGCGEYGEKLMRPHYHVCLFNFDFPDKKLFKIQNRQRLFISDLLNKVWPFGFSTVGTLTFESAAYTARYVMKKVTGSVAEDHYRYIHPITGEVIDRHPEFANMSRMPGIGRSWYEKFKHDIYPNDFMIINGKKCKPPRYYDSLYEKDDPDLFKALKERRFDKAQELSDDFTSDRLLVKEKIMQSRMQKLIRTIEKEYV